MSASTGSTIRFQQRHLWPGNASARQPRLPSIADTFTKIIKTHSMKAGFYWDAQENLQANGSPDQRRTIDVNSWGSTSTQNEDPRPPDGSPSNYSENNSDPSSGLSSCISGRSGAQDSWKATRKLTLNLGLRADHIGQWYDTIGGTQVWDPASYDNSSQRTGEHRVALAQDRLQRFHAPAGRASYSCYNPRLGFAYDVIRAPARQWFAAGFGTYRYQVSSNDASAAMIGPLGSFGSSPAARNVGVNGFYGYNIQGGVLCMHPDPGGLAGSCSGPTAKTATLPVPKGLNQNGADIHVDSRATTRFLTRIPTVSAWHRHCLGTP